MKYFWIFITSALASTMLFGAVSITSAEDTPPQSAVEKEANLQKVYYSESLGVDGEEKIYQVQSCLRAESMGPVRCTKENAKKYAKQCIDEKAKDEESSVRKGTIVRGCIKAVKDGETPKSQFYPEVDPDLNLIYKTEEQGGCSDAPTKQSPLYATEWKIVHNKDANGKIKAEKDWSILGSVISNTKPDGDQIKKDFGASADASAIFWKSVYCRTTDVPVGGTYSTEANKKEGEGELTQNAKTLTGAADPIATKLISLECNNSNSDVSKENEADLAGNIATPFNNTPSVTCTTKYRVAGKGGVDIFGRYVKYIYTWASGIVGIIAVLTIVYNGIIISASGGGETTEAKERIMQSLVGIAILFLAGLILYTINPGFFTA